jgi:hypothetical protein
LPYQVRIPVYETFPTEKKRTFWQLKHEELKRLAWTPAELEHINSFYSVICKNPLLMERGAESEELEDWFEVFRYNWREHGHDAFGWDGRVLYAISVSADELLNTSGELKVYTPITVGVKFWAATRSLFDDCPACNEGMDGEYFPHPEYCAAYYICFAGIATPEWCPLGMLFNPASQMCDWPTNMSCW